MVRDGVFKLICVPLLALIILGSSDLIAFRQVSTRDAVLTVILALLLALVIWQGTVMLISMVRNSRLRAFVYAKLLMLCFSTALYAVLALSGFLFLWQKIFGVSLSSGLVWQSVQICAASIVFFTLVYEVLFLHKERQIDSQIVRHLDKELLQAEINVLRNELDPHFVYNSLMPLYYLVKNDVQKAEAFAYKLIQVYQYFLENRQNDFITLEEELRFIENYFFLLQIRYKETVFLSVHISGDTNKLLVLPLSLQVVIENVIKHNDMCKEEPLHINIHMERNHLVVANNIRPKAYAITSSKIGLKNLRARYKILASSDISVVKNKDLFIVKIPLLRNAKAYDVNSYNRG